MAEHLIIERPGAARSKLYEFHAKVEASYIASPHEANEDQVLRVRMPSGHWLPIETWRRRCEALGIQVDDVWRSAGQGPHPVGS